MAIKGAGKIKRTSHFQGALGKSMLSFRSTIVYTFSDTIGGKNESIVIKVKR